MKRELRKHVALIALLGLLVVPSLASAATTSVSQVMSGGTLSVSSDASQTFTARTVTASEQSGTATVGISVSDTRGSGAGWTVTMTTTPLTTTRVFADSANAGSMALTVGDGKYNGSVGQTDNETPCMYTLSVTTPGAVGTAVFNSVANSSDNAACTGSAALSTSADEQAFGQGRGLTLDMTGTVNTGDKFYVIFDMYPDTDVSAACNAAAATSGTTDQVTAGSCGAFVDAGANTVSNAMTALTAAAGYGLGTYTQNIDYTLTIHQNAVVGTYAGTLTFTIA